MKLWENTNFNGNHRPFGVVCSLQPILGLEMVNSKESRGGGSLGRQKSFSDDERFFEVVRPPIVLSPYIKIEQRMNQYRNN